jgi:hypothetical protein
VPKRKGSIQKFVTRVKRDSIEKEQTQYTSGETSFLTPNHTNLRVAVARVVGRGCKGRLASSRKVTSIGLKLLSSHGLGGRISQVISRTLLRERNAVK